MLKERVSRRAFFAGVGGGLAASSLVWGIREFQRPEAVTSERPILDRNYVEYRGWILRRIDKERMLAVGVFK